MLLYPSPHFDSSQRQRFQLPRHRIAAARSVFNHHGLLVLRQSRFEHRLCIAANLIGIACEYLWSASSAFDAVFIRPSRLDLSTCTVIYEGLGM